MWKKKERWTAAALLLAMVVVTGLCWYILYIRQQFYDEGTRNLLETYEQVDKAFTIFSPEQLEHAERVGQEPAGCQ